MNDFYAAYLFLIGAVVMLVIGLWSKHFWIFIISATSWFMAGLYCILNAQGALWVDALGIFSIFCGICTLMIRAMLHKTEVIETLNKTRAEIVEDKLKKIRAARKSTIDSGY